MKRKNFRTAVLLIAIVSTCCFAADTNESGGVMLAYSKSAPDLRASILKSPSGESYRLSLIPDRDVQNHIVVFELMLQPATRGKRNLLYPPGNWHGYQPFFFAASDFARGAQSSIYGNPRTIPVPKLGFLVQVKVVGVKVEPIGGASAGALPYQFDELTLRVTTQPLPKN